MVGQQRFLKKDFNQKGEMWKEKNTGVSIAKRAF